MEGGSSEKRYKRSISYQQQQLDCKEVEIKERRRKSEDKKRQIRSNLEQNQQFKKALNKQKAEIEKQKHDLQEVRKQKIQLNKREQQEFRLLEKEKQKQCDEVFHFLQTFKSSMEKQSKSKLKSEEIYHRQKKIQQPESYPLQTPQQLQIHEKLRQLCLEQQRINQTDQQSDAQILMLKKEHQQISQNMNRLYQERLQIKRMKLQLQDNQQEQSERQVQLFRNIRQQQQQKLQDLRTILRLMMKFSSGSEQKFKEQIQLQLSSSDKSNKQ